MPKLIAPPMVLCYSGIGVCGGFCFELGMVGKLIGLWDFPHRIFAFWDVIVYIQKHLRILIQKAAPTMNKYDRMLHILNLLRSKKNMNAEALAKECAVTERTIYRDIISLSEMEIPIYYENGYKLASDNFLPPLNFSFDEYQLLCKALDASPLIKTDLYQKTYKNLKAKIDSCLSERVKYEAKVRPDTTHIENPLIDDDAHDEKYSQLEKAIANQYQIEIYYESLNGPKEKRNVDPYFMVYRNNAFYLVGFCYKRNDFRTFRIDRISSVEVLQLSFNKKEGVTAQSYFEGSWSVYGGEPYTVEAIFYGPAAKVVKTNKHHEGEVLSEQADGSIRYFVEVKGLEEIQRWLVGFGENVKIINPPELRINLKKLGQFYTRQYTG